jgi:diguanylate cyclase (GGDEF)-like protein
MLEPAEYKITLDNASIPVVIGKPINDGDKVVDFEILYLNQFFNKIFGNFVQEGMFYSQVKESLGKGMPWVDSVTKLMETGETQINTFYSPNFSCWYKTTLDKISDNLVSFFLIDISQDKEHEQQLRRQNLRLAALTDELSFSKENLRSKLENIESLNEELGYIAYHDALTGISNKQQFNADLQRCKKENQIDGMKFGIILIDLDNMKFINDSQGHAAGDEIICNAAIILKSFSRETIHAYRFSGDEFIVLCEQITSRDTLLNIADALLESFNTRGIEFSAGISVFPDDTQNLEELLKFADMAMYDVKKKGRNNISYFQTVMQDKFLRRVTLQNKITDALETNQFKLYYQPQFDVASGRLRGFEALLRWYDETLGWISPEQFVSVAEETRLILPLGEWVLETALTTLEDWCTNYGFDAILSVNVSPVQLKKPDFLYVLKQKIKKHHINTANLEIEITEGVLIDNKEETVKLLQQIRAMGIGISLDDFGTGYSSLNYLHILPITTLKIDKSFIANITSKTGVEANITDSIVSMVSKMGLDTIAEGVERPEQFSVLKQINCKTVQGFLKGKPMNKERCDKLLSGDTTALLTIENDG